jgi:glycerol-3-phosphate dehydrogenase
VTCEDVQVELVNSILGPSQREGALAALADHEFDVLVIGGGVTGAGCALDAASRGLSVALIEMRDWASGTSSRSGKLFHGGLRYLEQFNFGLVREALKERGLMLEMLCPHLVRPLEFIYPIEHRIWERAYMGAGLFLYDTIGGAGAVPRHKQLSRKQVLERAPGLSRKSLVGGISFFDAQVDDSRHTLELVRTAAAYGAVAATALKVIGISHDQTGAVNGVNVKDLENGSQFHISAKTVINATGVWTDSLQKMAGGNSDFSVQASKGVHILVPRDRIDSEVSVFVRAEDSVLFIRTWGAHWLIGTTDTPWELGLDHPAASATDIEYLLRNVNRVLNVELTVDDIDGVYAGLRPLIKGKEGATSDLSREHAVETSVPGFTTIAGGKYTTYRVMAEDAVNAAIVDLESRGLVQGVPQSETEDILLIGATNFDQVQTELRATGKNFGLNAKGIEHLLGRYGSMVGDLISILKYRPELAQPIAGGAGYLRVEALYAVTHEGALHIDDILTRRTHLSIETPDQGLEAAEEVAQIMGAELGWNQERTEAELVHYQDRVAAERKAHLAIGDSDAMAARNHVRDVRLTKV